MAHELEFVTTNGRREACLAYWGATPWHKHGTAVEEWVTRDPLEFQRRSKTAWEVELVDLQTVDKQQSVSDFQKAIRRKTDGQILGTCGPDWTPLQNAKLFEFFVPFIEANALRISSAGSLRGGQLVFVQGLIVGDPLRVVGDDTIDRYVLVSNFHKGGWSVRAGD